MTLFAINHMPIFKLLDIQGSVIVKVALADACVIFQ